MEYAIIACVDTQGFGSLGTYCSYNFENDFGPENHVNSPWECEKIYSYGSVEQCKSVIENAKKWIDYDFIYGVFIVDVSEAMKLVGTNIVN